MGSCGEEKLLMTLIKQLVNLTGEPLKEQQVCKNVQLAGILKQEFGIDIETKTEFEIDVFMSVIKKYLKIWPRWDEFDRILRQRKDDEITNKILNHQYVILKKYLCNALNQAIEAMKPYQEMLEKKMLAIQESEAIREETKEVVMEIVCSRPQLNQLIYKYPHPQMRTIFNIIEGASCSKIQMDTFTLKEIINWPNVIVILFIPGFECIRTNASTIERTILNMKRSENALRKSSIYELDDLVYFKRFGIVARKPKKCLVKQCLKQLKSIASILIKEETNKYIFETVMSELMLDLDRGPVEFDFGKYKYFLHNYKYVRHLNADPLIEGIDNNEDKFNLYLEELLTPILTLDFTSKMMSFLTELNIPRQYTQATSYIENNSNWMKIECLQCGKAFNLPTNYHKLLSHFEEVHRNEPKWTCTGCKVSFTMSECTNQRWTHNCVVNP